MTHLSCPIAGVLPKDGTSGQLLASTYYATSDHCTWIDMMQFRINLLFFEYLGTQRLPATKCVALPKPFMMKMFFYNLHKNFWLKIKFFDFPLNLSTSWILLDRSKNFWLILTFKKHFPPTVTTLKTLHTGRHEFWNLIPRDLKLFSTEIGCLPWGNLMKL